MVSEDWEFFEPHVLFFVNISLEQILLGYCIDKF